MCPYLSPNHPRQAVLSYWPTAESQSRASDRFSHDGRGKNQNELVELVQSLPGSTVENPTVGPLWRGLGAGASSKKPARHPTPGGGS